MSSLRTKAILKRRWVAVVLSCVACGAGDAVSSPDSVDEDSVDEGSEQGAATDEADEEGPVVAPWTLDASSMDWPLQALTRSCAEVSIPEESEIRMHCGDDGSVAALEAPVDFHLATKAGATMLHTTAEADATLAAQDARRPSVRVSATETLIVVEQITCGACRRVLGRAWVLDPARAPASVLTEAQQAASLGEPLLRTVDAWRHALARIRATP